MKNNRQIKFRAYDTRVKKFIDTGFHIIGGFMLFGGFDDWILNNEFKELGLLERYNDIVIQQFTGLQDKNGADIYEGDIVENLTTDEEYCSPALIVWAKYEYFGWSLAFKNKHLEDYQKKLLEHETVAGIVYEEFQLTRYGNYKIIGNIFENPELLESKS